MDTPDTGSNEQNLSRLFQSYREACPDPDPSVNFMPELWARIEARQTFVFNLRRVASRLVTAAVAVTLAMAVYLYFPQRPTPFYSESYIEALAAPSGDSADLFEAHFDLSDSVDEL